MQRVLLWLLALAFLQLPAFAQDLLEPFEAALDDRRYTLAARLVDRLPESPEKLLARAELGIVTGCAHTSYALADQIAPASLSPRLRAKYLLIRARQEEIATRHGPARESLERLLRDGLAADPSPHDRAELLRIQQTLAHEDKARAEKIVAELFKISTTAGFGGRLRLLSGDQTEEALALAGLLEQQALAASKPALALDYRLQRAYLFLRLDRYGEAEAAARSMLDAALEAGETHRVPLALVYLSWCLQGQGKGITTETFDQTLARLAPGYVALETLWLAQRKFPQESRYFEQGLTMARTLELPLVEAAFLLQRAETDLSRADAYRRQARELTRGLDLRGVGNTWFGDAVSNSIYAVGLDTDDDEEMWPRYLELLESGRTEGEITEFWSAMIGGLPDRQAGWVWFEPLIESILERTSDWSKRARASEIFGAASLLSRSWVSPRHSGQATTFAARDDVLAQVLGIRLAEDPKLLDELLLGLAQWDQEDPGAGQAATKLVSLGHILAAMGRNQEAADLFAGAFDRDEDSRLLELRRLGARAYTEYQLGQAAAVPRLEELALANFSSDLGVYDQPWRRATELAWWSLENNRPAEAERLARAGLKAVRKDWAPYLHRRLGAYEVLAFALAAQGRDQEVSDLLEKLRQEQGPAGETWLATLRADLLLRAENPAAAALVVPVKGLGGVVG